MSNTPSGHYNRILFLLGMVRIWRGLQVQRILIFTISFIYLYLWARRSKINFRSRCIFLVWESNPIAPEGYKKYFPHLSAASCQSTNKDIHSLQRVGLKTKGGYWGFWYPEPLAPEKTIWEWYTLKLPIGKEELTVKNEAFSSSRAFFWEPNPALAQYHGFS